MNESYQLLFENNLHESHWGKRIIAAEINGFWDKSDYRAAGAWFSCACGKLDDHIERIGNVPVDDKLKMLGHRFSMWVDEKLPLCTLRDFFRAAETLVAIEKRSIELLEESLK
jgi:hypothetical protein